MIGNHHPFDFLIFSLDKIWVSLITKKTTIYYPAYSRDSLKNQMEVTLKKWLRTFWKYLKVQYFKATLNLVSTFFQSYHNSQGTGSSPSGMGGIGILPWSGVGMVSLPPHPRRCDGQGKPRNLSEEKDVGFSRCVWYWVESRLLQTPKIVFFFNDLFVVKRMALTKMNNNLIICTW